MDDKIKPTPEEPLSPLKLTAPPSTDSMHQIATSAAAVELPSLLDGLGIDRLAMLEQEVKAALARREEDGSLKKKVSKASRSKREGKPSRQKAQPTVAPAPPPADDGMSSVGISEGSRWHGVAPGSSMEPAGPTAIRKAPMKATQDTSLLSNAYGLD